MIVQPDFIEHWKTRALVELTKDESAPLAVIRLWSHCQHSKRSHFPEMTPAQLASICRWEKRKPACHVAMVKAGFVDRLTPKGFAAHQWDEHNRQLFQKWEAGKNGGRPPKSENTNELPLDEKPTDNRPITVRELDRPDQTRPDQIEKIRPDQTSPDASPISTLRVSSSGGGMDALKKDTGIGGVGLDGMIGKLAKSKRLLTFTPPSLAEVRAYLHNEFAGGAEFAEAFFNTMTEQGWRDKQGVPITSWRSMAKSYASAAWRNKTKA